jgi:hypothetical protein
VAIRSLGSNGATIQPQLVEAADNQDSESDRRCSILPVMDESLYWRRRNTGDVDAARRLEQELTGD